jgi:hypothetical protein
MTHLQQLRSQTATRFRCTAFENFILKLVFIIVVVLIIITTTNINIILPSVDPIWPAVVSSGNISFIFKDLQKAFSSF